MLRELPKCDRDMQWESAIGKMAPIGLLDAGLPQTFNLKKHGICKAQKPEA